jgi:hypothetical protein
MARGTWQGGGTWQTTGGFSLGNPGPVIAVAAVVVITGLVEWVVSHVWQLIGATVLLVAVIVAVVGALSRWTDRREAAFAERRRLELAAQGAAELPRPQRPALEAVPRLTAIEHYHYGPQVYVYGRDSEEAAARIIRQALPRTAEKPMVGGEP